MESLLRLFQDNPALGQGFLGGVVGAIVVNFVTWRWTISRRKHED